jgi:hypothetical protein
LEFKEKNVVAKAKKSKLPKWLIAEDVQCTRWFIVHTEFPRFVGEIFDNEEVGGNIIGFPKGEVVMIDSYPIDRRTAPAIAKLMREAGDALLKYDAINDQKAKEAEEDED